MMKSLFTLVITLVMALSSFIGVYAEDKNVTVVGTVEMAAESSSSSSSSSSTPGGDTPEDPVTTIDVTVPAKMTFIIDENRDLISPDYSIINNGTTSVTATAISLFATPETSAKIVANDKYTADEWKNLSVSDTISQIALGLNVSGTTDWFNAEPAYSVVSLGSMSPSSSRTFTINGEYGYDWENDENLVLNYKMTLLLEAE